MNTACVLRFSGYGDAIHVTPLFPLLKERGYRVQLHCHKYLLEIFDFNPYIDEIVTYGKEIPDTLQLPKDALIIDTVGTRGFMLRPEDGKPLGCETHLGGPVVGCDGCKAEKMKRVGEYGHVNYHDFYMELAGFSERGLTGQLFFSEEEIAKAEEQARQWAGRFVVFWAMSNTSWHKHYPWWGDVSVEFCRRHPEALVYSLGDTSSKCLEVEGHPQIIPKSGEWGMRYTCSLLPYIGLFCGGEGGLLNAAGCYETPKVVLLSHSSPENLTKYWTNCSVIRPEVDCHPCHQLHDTLESCPLVRIETSYPKLSRRWPACMGGAISPNSVLDEMAHWLKFHKTGN